MTIQTLQAFFMWCSIINFALLMLIAILCVAASDWIYRTQTRWIPLSRPTFDTILYGFIGLFKLLWIFFNLVPWFALCLVG